MSYCWRVSNLDFTGLVSQNHAYKTRNWFVVAQFIVLFTFKCVFDTMNCATTNAFPTKLTLMGRFPKRAYR